MTEQDTYSRGAVAALAAIALAGILGAGMLVPLAQGSYGDLIPGALALLPALVTCRAIALLVTGEYRRSKVLLGVGALVAVLAAFAMFVLAAGTCFTDGNSPPPACNRTGDAANHAFVLFILASIGSLLALLLPFNRRASP